ncbi:hypothetical protein OA90_09520 [Labrenzia sp. OB1]|nr:hypothetical protein OA90_09520 [Labrenzia sp. OB1]
MLETSYRKESGNKGGKGRVKGEFARRAEGREPGRLANFRWRKQTSDLTKRTMDSGPLLAEGTAAGLAGVGEGGWIGLHLYSGLG